MGRAHCRRRVLWLLATTLACGSGLLVLAPIPQDPNYHNFADQRTFFGIPHFANVISNLPLVLVGIVGLGLLHASSQPDGHKGLVIPYAIFFFSILLTGLGSSYYHLSPENKTLVWDRYPMAMAFMALFGAVLMEHISYKGGSILLFPLLALGLFSVWYWNITEQLGIGDLRLYVGIQFLPLLLIPLIMALFRSGYTKRRYFLYALSLYALAKSVEHFDAEIFQATLVVSGHSLKHLIAALAALIILAMYLQRRPVTDGEPKTT